MPDFLSQPMVEIARRLDIRGPNPWLAVLGPPSDSTVALDELQTELRSFLQIPTRVFSLETATFVELREALQEPSDDAVVLTAGADLTNREEKRMARLLKAWPVPRLQGLSTV